MHFVLNIDNHFVPQVSSLIASVLCAGAETGEKSQMRLPASEGRRVFHILSKEISEENKSMLTEYTEKNGGQIFFYELGSFEDTLTQKLKQIPDTGRFPVTVLARIFAAELLPAEIRRFLYLDADMAVLKDPEPLFSVDLQGNILAACAEPTIYRDLSPAAGEAKGYFNAGLLLIDRDLWEKEKITEKCMQWYAENNGTFAFADQDILNHVLGNRVLFLDQQWNFLSNYRYLSYRSLVRRSPWYGKLISEEAYRAAKKAPAIVHFAGDERPWYRGNHNPYAGLYHRFLAMTPWKDTPPVPGKEAYMFLYHIMNLFSAVFPDFRTWVSEAWYRKQKKRSSAK